MDFAMSRAIAVGWQAERPATNEKCIDIVGDPVLLDATLHIGRPVMPFSPNQLALECRSSLNGKVGGHHRECGVWVGMRHTEGSFETTCLDATSDGILQHICSVQEG